MLFQISKRNVFIISSIALVMLAAAVFLIVNERSSQGDKQLKIMSDNIDLQIKDILYTDVGDSGLKWEIRANTAKYMKNENLAVFDKVTVKLIMQGGKTFIMTGNTGRLNTETKNMEISGNVTIDSDQGDHLTTDVLTYSDSDQKFHTDSPIEMKNSRMQVQGTGMSFSLKDKDISLLSKVKARIN
jgi:LPS export ABC transporter protein LptC